MISGLEEHLADPALGEHVQDGDRDGEAEAARDREEARLDAANLVDAREFRLDGIVIAECVGADVRAWRSLKKAWCQVNLDRCLALCLMLFARRTWALVEHLQQCIRGPLAARVGELSGGACAVDRTWEH